MCFISAQDRQAEIIVCRYSEGISQCNTDRAIYMKLPKELGFGSDLVARQVRCVSGTRDAGKLWEDTYTQALEHSGLATGMAAPCVFVHRVKDITIVVHGDDLTALGTDADLDWYEQALQESFEFELRGRLGENCPGPQGNSYSQQSRFSRFKRPYL